MQCPTVMETAFAAFGADVKEQDRTKQELIQVHAGYFNSLHLPMTDRTIHSNLFLRLSVRSTKPVTQVPAAGDRDRWPMTTECSGGH
jgi:hypothetical protein